MDDLTVLTDAQLLSRWEGFQTDLSLGIGEGAQEEIKEIEKELTNRGLIADSGFCQGCMGALIGGLCTRGTLTCNCFKGGLWSATNEDK